MKKFYEGIEADFIIFQAEDVVMASMTLGDGENYIGGELGIGNID